MTRRSSDDDTLDALIEARAKRIYEETFLHETDTASWEAALEYELTARVDACREQARRELSKRTVIPPLRTGRVG